MLNKILKRLFDIIFSILGIILMVPVFIIISIAIKVSMPGEIFFKQIRIGKKRKEFKILKFRTMLSLNNKSNERFDAGDSSRITPLGAKLRKCKLDELPQLINILKGDMSFVGPRPEIKKWTSIYTDKWDLVLNVKPGITDNASIIFRNEEEILANSEDPEKTYKDEILPQKLDLYISYVNKNSFWGDINIIGRTIKTVIKE